MQQKKIPLRKCSGCGEMKDKRELVRIVKSPEGVISVDITGKKNGRGAYICKSSACLLKAKKSRHIERSFQCAISDEIYEELSNQLTAYEQ